MKTSELIQQLQSTMELCGDLEVISLDQHSPSGGTPLVQVRKSVRSTYGETIPLAEYGKAGEKTVEHVLFLTPRRLWVDKD